MSQFVGQCKRAGDNIKGSQQASLRAAAEVAQATMQAAAEAARTRGVRTRVTSFAHSSTGEAVNVSYSPPGWVRIMNDATKKHFIQSRKSGSVRSRSAVGRKRQAAATPLGGVGGYKAPINIKGVGPRAYAFHPGTKGKHFAAKGIKTAEPGATRVYQEAQRREIRRAFGG